MHLALYGNVKIQRGHCPDCDCTALVVGGCFACCDRLVADVPLKAKRMSEPEQRRKRPSLTERKSIVESQGNACLYCDRGFGSHVMRKGRLVRLRLVWDRVLPFAYSADNKPANFVAACHVCNGWKSDLVFQTLSEARVFLQARWAADLDRASKH